MKLRREGKDCVPIYSPKGTECAAGWTSPAPGRGEGEGKEARLYVGRASPVGDVAAYAALPLVARPLRLHTQGTKPEARGIVLLRQES